MKNDTSVKQTLRSAEIVLLGDVEDLTKGIEIGNLKDQSRVGWRPWTAASKSKKRAATKRKKAAAKTTKAKKNRKKK